MGARFHDLPMEVFPPEAQPYIKRLNRELRDLFALEGVLRSESGNRRSDQTIVRREDLAVDVSRVSSGGSSTQVLSDDTPEPVASVGDPGTDTSASRGDHAHAGLHSITANGGTQILGDANIVGQSYITLAVSGQSITIQGSSSDLNSDYLRRDGSETVTGNILPDTDNTRNLGDAVTPTAYAQVVANQHIGVGGAPAFLVTTDGVNSQGLIWLDTSGPKFLTNGVPATRYKATDLVAGDNAYLALENFTPLNRLKTATAAYSMGGFNLTGLGGLLANADNANDIGAVATRFANAYLINVDGGASLLTLKSTKAAASGVVGVTLNWEPTAAVAANYWPMGVQYRNAGGLVGVARIGYSSTTQACLWLMDKDGGNDSGITEYLITAGDTHAITGAGTAGFRLLPNNFSGAIWVYAGGTVALDIRKNTTQVTLGSGWSLAALTNFIMRATRTAGDFDVAGSFQFGMDGTIAAPAAGRIFNFLRGVPPGSGSTDYTTSLGFIDYRGRYYSGQNGDGATAPADGGSFAAGWVDASSSSNQAGVDYLIGGGAGTGNSTTKGGILFQTPDAGASGTAVQSLTTKVQITRAGFKLHYTESGITASTTQSQGQGPITREINEVSAVANIGDTVTLPTAEIGKRCVILNNGANALRIFPASGDNLGAGADTQMTTDLAAGDMIVFFAYDATNWRGFRETMET